MPTAPADTRQRLLDLATDLVERLGYNAFSYRDLAGAAKITTASIHYHFPTKGDLGLALVQQQRQQDAVFRNRLDAEQPNAWNRIAAFAEGFRAMLEQGQRMCLCGMLAAERPTLPENVAEEVQGFFRDNEAWLSDVLLEGRKAGSVVFPGSAAAVAQSIMSAIEGAMLVAKAFRDDERFHAAMKWHLAQIQA